MDSIVMENKKNGIRKQTKNTKEELVYYKLKKSQKIYIFFKNINEWILAFLAIHLLLPLWIVLAIVIVCDSKGPAIFRHSRIGKNRKKFKCCKWRSMKVNTPKHIASRDFDNADEYITKVGKFIRKTSIDEFAQLLNILSGKMSLIGYRPLVEKDAEIDEMRAKMGVYQIKPGISGWAQVNGRDLVEVHDKAHLDQYYLEHISFWLDVKIFFMTIKKIFKRSDIKEGSIDGKKRKRKNTFSYKKKNVDEKMNLDNFKTEGNNNA